jgi:O-antigen/teichoic acid export membrane protein
VDYIFEDQIGDILRIASVVSFSFILPFFMELVLKGSNHIEYLSLFHFVWKILFIVLLAFLYVFAMLSPIAVILMLSIGCILAFLIIIFNLRPSNARTKEILIKLRNENKSYGFHVYTARIMDTATFQLDRLMISFFVGSTSVGFYSLAFALALPLNAFSTALSSSKFKSFSNGKAVPNNILVANFIWILIASLGIVTVGYFIVYYFLGIAYAEVFPLLIVLVCAVFFQASYQPYNAWICSVGFGKEVKIKTYITAFINILFNIVLIPYYGALGAAIASLISMFASFVIYFYLYSKLARKLI